MRLAWIASLPLLGCAVPGPGPVEDGTRALFDGRSLDGWEGDERFWRVEDGVIVGESTAERPCERTTYLVWRGGTVADFELELEWRFPDPGAGANSGLQFRSLVLATDDVRGYQADLETGPDWTGGLYEQGGRGVITRRGERIVLGVDGTRTVERFAASEQLLARVRPGVWNRLRVTAFGPRLSIEVNGEPFSETVDLDPDHAVRSGAFALQLHAGPPMRVEFRDLRLRPLGATAAREPHADASPASPASPMAPSIAGAASSDGVPSDAVPTPPQWIWPPVPVASRQAAWLRRAFELPAQPVRARLWISGDNHFVAWLGPPDGEPVGAGDEWWHPQTLDVTQGLREGPNELLVRVENDESQAGLVCTLEVELEGGATFVLHSDESFEACLEPGGLDGTRRGAWIADARWESARALGALGVSPWGGLGQVADEADETTGEAPAGEEITVPPGFTVERLYSVPRSSQGSWVALCVDPRGRFYASDQYGGIYRVTVPALGSGEAARVEAVPIELGEAQGLLWAFDALYAVVNHGGSRTSGLYRARDSDGDDVLDEVTCLRTFDGEGEHGPHGLVLDPDGRSLVVIGGNHTALPGPFVRSRVPRHWGEDALLPPLDDPNGHAVGITAPGGWVVRTDPEGREWELVAVGMRNAYDLAFDPQGELFTFDSDMEWDDGLPWYRPTRILHLVSGADFGWRSGSAKWPADSFDSLPAAVDIGLGSPTGIVFGTGTRFPSPWREALFACDWAYGRVWAVSLEPEGASFHGRATLFAHGAPFPVTDAAVGPDGALYLTIGGRRTQSGLYRIAWSGPEPAPASAPAEGAEARARRRALAELHGRAGEADPEAAVRAAWASLGDPDPFLRHAARVVLEDVDPRAWRAAVDTETDARTALEGLLARLHADPACEARALVQRALALFAAADPADRRLRQDALRLLELVFARRSPGSEEAALVRRALDRAWPSGDARLDRALLPLLVATGADVAGRALDELARAERQEDRIALLYALRAHAGPWDEDTARRCLDAFAREEAAARGGASVEGYVAAMGAEARDRLQPLVGKGPEAALAPLPAGAPTVVRAIEVGPVHRWTVSELEARLGALERPTEGTRRDLARGRALYEAASCNRCHRLAGTGQNLGPDLTGAAGRYSPRDLLVAILEPSREVPDVWRDTEFWSDPAQLGLERLLAVGRLESERGGELVVREASGARVRLESESVATRTPHALSRMPEGLLDTLREEEILDLLAYVLAGGVGDSGGSR